MRVIHKALFIAAFVLGISPFAAAMGHKPRTEVPSWVIFRRDLPSKNQPALRVRLKAGDEIRSPLAVPADVLFDNAFLIRMDPGSTLRINKIQGIGNDVHVDTVLLAGSALVKSNLVQISSSTISVQAGKLRTLCNSGVYIVQISSPIPSVGVLTGTVETPGAVVTSGQILQQPSSGQKPLARAMTPEELTVSQVQANGVDLESALAAEQSADERAPISAQRQRASPLKMWRRRNVEIPGTTGARHAPSGDQESSDPAMQGQSFPKNDQKLKP